MSHAERLSLLGVRGRRVPPHILAAVMALVGTEEVNKSLCDLRADERQEGVEWRVLVTTATRMIYVADAGPATLDWTSTFPGSQAPPTLGVYSWAHPLPEIHAHVTHVRAHNSWDWVAELTWRIDAAGTDWCTVPLFDNGDAARAEEFMSALVAV